MAGGAVMIGALVVVVSYVASSAFFWQRPHLIHKRKSNGQAFRGRTRYLHISHRGGSSEGYENTLIAFRRAINAGTDMLELDVRLTKDKKVVVFHDPDLFRLTGSKALLKDVDYKDLPVLKPAVPIDTIPGHLYTDSTLKNEDDRRIPLLSQIFEEFRTIPINLDIKDTDTSMSRELVLQVAKLIKQYNREHLTVWGSFNENVNKTLYQTNPNVGLFFSLRKALLVIIMTVTGILPFVPIKETHYEVFLPSAIKRRRLRQVETLPLYEKLLFWFSAKFLVCKPLVNHLRRRGIHVYLWVLNSEEEFAEAIEIGANGIMTDYPTRLRTYLDTLEDNKEQAT